MLDERKMIIIYWWITFVFLPIAILVFSKPMIQTRNGVNTAVCSIDVLNGIIKTTTKRKELFNYL
jgi:predicted secreted protein